MRKIRVKKPDIKGFFQRVRNIRWRDIEQDIKARERTRGADSGKAQKQCVCKEDAAGL